MNDYQDALNNICRLIVHWADCSREKATLQELVDRATAYKLTHIYQHEHWGYITGKCKCGRNNYSHHKFCFHCGQALDFGSENEK